MFRARFERGFVQHLRCFIGSTLEGAQTCRECTIRYTCKDYMFRRKLWVISKGNAFDAIMRLDVDDIEEKET